MPRKQEATETAPSLGADILAAGVPTNGAPVDESPRADASPTFEPDAVLTPEASAAEPPIEDQQPRVTAPATDYGSNEATRKVHPAARAPQGQRFSNVGNVPEAKPVELTFVRVTIERDMSTKMEKDVPLYLVPILELVHAGGMVAVEPGSEHKVLVDRFDPAQEFYMLGQRYDSPSKKHVSVAYPLGPAQLAQVAGVPFAQGGGKFQQPQSEQTIRPREGQVLRNRA